MVRKLNVLGAETPLLGVDASPVEARPACSEFVESTVGYFIFCLSMLKYNPGLAARLSVAFVTLNYNVRGEKDELCHKRTPHRAHSQITHFPKPPDVTSISFGGRHFNMGIQ